jgi:hypothetical protein
MNTEARKRKLPTPRRLDVMRKRPGACAGYLPSGPTVASRAGPSICLSNA